MSPPPEYSHSFAQTTNEHADTRSKPLSQFLPVQDVDENTDVIQEELPYPEAPPSELTHPPDFRPFFTLIEDPETGEHYHPNIHYIFNDDDPAFLTTAILDSIAFQNDESLATHVPERVVVLDVSPDGKTVTDAQSLSTDWQISNTTITQAPSWNEADAGKREGSLLLTISGTEGHGRPIQPQRRASMEGMLGRVDAVITGYHERLNALDKLVRRDVVGYVGAEGIAEDHEEDESETR